MRSPLDARRSLLEVFCSLAIVDHSLTQDERILLTIAESELNLPGFLQHFFAGSSSEFSGNAEDVVYNNNQQLKTVVEN